MNNISISAKTLNGKDICVKTALSLLNNLSYSDIKNLSNNSHEFEAVLLARISEVNYELVVLMDTSLDMIIDNYAEPLTKEIIKNNRLTLSADKLDKFKAIKDSVSVNAEQYMRTLELQYNLSPGDIVLSSNQTGTELELAQSENYSQDIFNFVESKNLINLTLTALMYDSDKMEELLASEATTYISFVIKIKDMMQKYQDILVSIISILEQAQQMIDSCIVAEYVWNNVCNASREKLIMLLSRKYNDIKETILPLIS